MLPNATLFERGWGCLISGYILRGYTAYILFNLTPWRPVNFEIFEVNPLSLQFCAISRSETTTNVAHEVEMDHYASMYQNVTYLEPWSPRVGGSKILDVSGTLQRPDSREVAVPLRGVWGEEQRREEE